MKTREGDPTHPIVDRPWEYDVVGFNYQLSPPDCDEPYIDLTLRKGTLVRRLRFLSPRNLKIDEGFPFFSHGMVILDVSARQLDELNVWVHDFEASPGGVTFWARTVVDLDQLETG
jgi:hypothetical protein